MKMRNTIRKMKEMQRILHVPWSLRQKVLLEQELVVDDLWQWTSTLTFRCAKAFVISHYLLLKIHQLAKINLLQNAIHAPKVEQFLRILLKINAIKIILYEFKFVSEGLSLICSILLFFETILYQINSFV